MSGRVVNFHRRPELGAGKMVWGSEGLHKVPDSLAEMLRKLDAMGATEGEKSLVLGGTAEKLLKLPKG